VVRLGFAERQELGPDLGATPLDLGQRVRMQLAHHHATARLDDSGLLGSVPDGLR